MAAGRMRAETSEQGADRAERRAVVLPARVMWKDARGATRFASVRTRNISETGVFIECSEPVSLPLEREARNTDVIPAVLRRGKVLSAVYRLGKFQKTTGTPEGYGLRLLVEPAIASLRSDPVEATA